MSETNDTVVAESKVSGNQANIPAHVRRELDIEDGDGLRWVFDEDETLQVEVVHRRSGTFDGFDGYESNDGGDVVEDHDTFGVDSEQRDE